MVCRGHFGSGLYAAGRYSFALGVPAVVERLKGGLLTCGFMSRPPLSELLIPALTARCSADTDVHPPDGRMSISSHDHLLGFLRAPTFCRTRSDLPTA